MSEPRKTYSIEFKRDAVKLLTEEGYTYKQASESLGVAVSVLTRWKREYGGVSSSELNDREELKRLQEENRRLRMEREILKKAAAFFARESL